MWNVKAHAPLFGFWFVAGRVVYAVGYLLTTLTGGVNLKVMGVAMTYFTVGLMVAEAMGIDGFQCFGVVGQLVGEL